jgi:protein SCO1
MSGMAHRARFDLKLARLATMLLAVAAVAAAFPAIARSDGDPASDYLLANQVFVTSPSGSLSPAQRQLVRTVTAANRAGYTIRVAVIAGTPDLGAIPQLWHQPQTYARFLGEELSLAYKQRLLVVMPNGFGFNWPGHSSAPEYRVLAKVPIKPGSQGLSASAQVAVQRLSGAHISGASSVPVSAVSSGPSTLLVVLMVLGVLVALVVVLVLRLWAKRHPRGVGRRRRPISIPRPLPLGVHLAIAIAVVLCASGGAAAVVLTHQGGTASNGVSLAKLGVTPSVKSASAVVTPPPFSWHAGRRRAPGFLLRDQSGGPVSLASYRGHPVIVTFIDPVCRNVCPLEAKVLDEADQQIPLAQRPEILAVSVDRYANSRADLLKDARKWQLVPEWRWAVGSPAKLAAVWKDYKISVSTDRVKVGGKTITSIIHTAATYIIDKTGHERALFLWPFYPQDVDHELRKIA